MMGCFTEPYPDYDDIPPPEPKNWLDITTPSDKAVGMKVYLNTLTHKVVSYPFNKESLNVD